MRFVSTSHVRFAASISALVLTFGTVSSVIANTEPQSLKSQVAIEPVAFVLELNAGTAARLGIDENSRIYWEPVHGSND